MKIYFVTANEKKIAESDERLKRFVERVQTQEGVRLEIEICPFKKHLDELLDPDIKRIVWKKAIEAYRVVHLPCVVEHGGLFLDAWQGSPGYWEGLGRSSGMRWATACVASFARKIRGEPRRNPSSDIAMADAFESIPGSPRAKSRSTRGATEGFDGIPSLSRPAAI